MKKWGISLTCLILLIGLSAYASGQFLKIDGQIINRMAIVSVGKIEKPYRSCICTLSDCVRWKFKVYPTTNFKNPIVISGYNYSDVRAKHKKIEDWLILGK